MTQQTSETQQVAELLTELWRRWRQMSHPVRRGAITWGQYMLLRRLSGRGPMPVSVLARAEGVQASTITVTTKRLQDMGYLRRERSAEDERVVLVSLTELAERQLGAWQDAQMRAISDLVGRLRDAEQQELRRMLLCMLDGGGQADG